MTCFVVGLEDNLILVHIRIMEKLATLIPDFNILVDVFNDMKAKHNEDMADIEDSKKT